jgi:hypothetical protein
VTIKKERVFAKTLCSPTEIMSLVYVPETKPSHEAHARGCTIDLVHPHLDLEAFHLRIAPPGLVLPRVGAPCRPTRSCGPPVPMHTHLVRREALPDTRHGLHGSLWRQGPAQHTHTTSGLPCSSSELCECS